VLKDEAARCRVREVPMPVNLSFELTGRHGNGFSKRFLDQ
jgi:hypothetical protein